MEKSHAFLGLLRRHEVTSAKLKHQEERLLPDDVQTKVVPFLERWIHEMHQKLVDLKLQGHDADKPDAKRNYRMVWDTYHNHVVDGGLLEWDKSYLLNKFPKRRADEGSIFPSIASFRDPQCPATLIDAFTKAKNPSKLFVGPTELC
mgnify:CR=1 FL=1